MHRLLALVALAGCALDPITETAETSAAVTGRPIVVADFDMDFDDTAALAYLTAAHKQGLIDLRAVTVANNGANVAGLGIHYLRCTLEAAGLPAIPVADNGAAIGPNFPSVAIRAVVQAVLAQTFPTCTASPLAPALTAAQLLAQTIGANQNVVVVTGGPHTNMAAALAARPDLPSHIAAQYSMSGALYVKPGIEGEWSLVYDGTQELNAFIDPPATAAVVAKLRDKLHLVGVDATNHVPMTAPFAARLAAEAITPEGQIVSAIANHPVLAVGAAAGMVGYWWDPLAAAAAVTGALVDFQPVTISVVLAGPQAGRTLPTPALLGGIPIRGGVTADQAAFEDEFIATLNGH